MQSILGVVFVAQEPYRTWAVKISRDDADIDGKVSAWERAAVKKILAAFEEAGWSVQDYGLADTNFPCWEIGKAGTEVFGLWSDEDAKKNIAEARKILRKFGITKVPKYKLTLADLM